MARVFRVMKEEGGKPMCGETANMLGVRTPKDIEPDNQGNVHAGCRGMSVSPSLEVLPFFLIPRRLTRLVAGASGNNICSVWRYGEGRFSDAQITVALQLRVTDDNHGVVAPTKTMHISKYREALYQTKEGWVKDESTRQSASI